MPGIETVIEKLIKLKGYLERLEMIQPASFQAYVADITIKYAIERIMQLIVDAALDINNILLVFCQKPPAADYFNSFVDLGESGVLTPDFALRIAPSTGLRNRLVHEYEKINDEIVYQSIEKMVRIYTEYLQAINQYIQDKT